jgi:hypothetical protein
MLSDNVISSNLLYESRRHLKIDKNYTNNLYYSIAYDETYVYVGVDSSQA